LLVVIVGCCWGDAMAKKVNKDRIVSFRLTEEQDAPFKAIYEKAGVSRSQFYRDMTLNKNPVFKESSKNYES
jgi:DNA-binding phage protein